jgi:4-hydroxybenzoate polyprenyltransferase
MTARTAGLRDWIELARLSNLPTVLTNVLTGGALAGAALGLEWLRLTAAGAAVVGLYVAGMMLNDVADATHDSVVRPERPIPSGRVARRDAAGAVAVLAAAAVALLAALGPAPLAAGLLLLSCIVAYDLLHRQRPWTVCLMGGCRGLVYWVAAAGIAWPTSTSALIAVSATVAIYTLAFTWVARSENEPQLDRRRWIAALLPLLVLAPALVIRPRSWIGAIAVAALLAVVLTEAARRVLRRPPRTRAAVLLWLSGLCLMDAYFLMLLERRGLAGLAMVCWVATVIGHRRIAGT